MKNFTRCCYLLIPVLLCLDATPVLFGSIPANNGTLIGEANTINRRQNSANRWITVRLNHSYTNPVVIMQPLSRNDAEPATVRIRNVREQQFQFQIDEWDYLDGEHGRETMSYVVLEAGSYTLPNGDYLEVGLTEANQRFRQVRFAERFDRAPVVLSQAQTVNEAGAVVTRVRNINRRGFRVRVQEEEAADGRHRRESIGYVAIERGAGTLGDITYEADRTGNNVNNRWRSLDFDRAYCEPPLFLAGMQTYNETDTANLRYRNLAVSSTMRSSAQIRVQEERSQDNEIRHRNENIGYWVLSRAGDIVVEDPSPLIIYTGEDAGRTSGLCVREPFGQGSTSANDDFTAYTGSFSRRLSSSSASAFGAVLVFDLPPWDYTSYDFVRFAVHAPDVTNPDLSVSPKLYFSGDERTGPGWEEREQRTLLMEARDGWLDIIVFLDESGFEPVPDNGIASAPFDLSQLTGVGILMTAPGSEATLYFDDVVIAQMEFDHIEVDVPERVFTTAPFEIVVNSVSLEGLIVDDFRGDVTLSDSNNALDISSEVNWYRGQARFWAEVLPDTDVRSTTLRVSVANQTLEQAITIRAGGNSADERNFIRSLRHPESGLVSNERNGTISNLYTNALAAMVFTYYGNTEQAQQNRYHGYAQQIFDTLQTFQYSAANPHPHLANRRRFYGALPNALSHDGNADRTRFGIRADGTPLEGGVLRAGSLAWYLMALSYYTLTSGDEAYLDSIEALADFLVNTLQQNDPTYPDAQGAVTFGYGGLSPAEFFAPEDFTNSNTQRRLDPNREPAWRKFIATEHQTEAYAALRYTAQIGALADKSETYRQAAERILHFVRDVLYNPNNPRDVSDLEPFFHTGYKILDSELSTVSPFSDEPPAMDAQTWTTLALASSLPEIDFTAVLDYAEQNLRGEAVINNRHVTATTWYQGDQGIWLEGYAQLGAVYRYAYESLPQGRRRDRNKANAILENMAGMQHPSGGFPTFSDGYSTRWDSNPRETSPAVVATAWRFFHLNRFNPYAAETVVID